MVLTFYIWICGSACKWHLLFLVLYCIGTGVLRNYMNIQLWDGNILVKLLPKPPYSPDFRLFCNGIV